MWAQHCQATHTQPQWKQARAQWAASGGKPPAPKAAASSSSSAASSSSSSSQPAAPKQPPAKQADWSCEQLLKAIECVYPVETPEPPGFAPGMQLRPYQRQSLAFMLDVERSKDQSLVGRDRDPSLYVSTTGRSGSSGVRGGWLCDEMGMGKTAVITALVLAKKPQLTQAQRRRRG